MLLLLIILIVIVVLLIILRVNINSLEPFQTDTSNGFVSACNEINSKRLFLRGYIQSLRAPVQDLSAAMMNVYYGKKENMAYQDMFTKYCLDRGINNACKKLASVDVYPFKVLPDMLVFYRNLLLGGIDIDGLLQTLNFYAELLNCPLDSRNNATRDTSGNEVFENSRDVGMVDINGLAYELEKLSPYYLSPDVVEFLLRFLISREQLNNLNFTSSDYVKQEIELISDIECLYGPNPSSC
jgi:hypothetical protein